MATVQRALAQAAERLQASDSAVLDAQLLLAHVLGKDRSWLFAWPERQLTREQQRAFDALVRSCLEG